MRAPRTTARAGAPDVRPAAGPVPRAPGSPLPADGDRSGAVAASLTPDASPPARRLPGSAVPSMACCSRRAIAPPKPSSRPPAGISGAATTGRYRLRRAASYAPTWTNVPLPRRSPSPTSPPGFTSSDVSPVYVTTTSMPSSFVATVTIRRPAIVPTKRTRPLVTARATPPIAIASAPRFQPRTKRRDSS